MSNNSPKVKAINPYIEQELAWWWRARQILDIGRAVVKTIRNPRRVEVIVQQLNELEKLIEKSTENERRFLIVDGVEIINLAWQEVMTETVNILGQHKP